MGTVQTYVMTDYRAFKRTVDEIPDYSSPGYQRQTCQAVPWVLHANSPLSKFEKAHPWRGNANVSPTIPVISGFPKHVLVSSHKPNQPQVANEIEKYERDHAPEKSCGDVWAVACEHTVYLALRSMAKLGMKMTSLMYAVNATILRLFPPGMSLKFTLLVIILLYSQCRVTRTQR